MTGRAAAFFDMDRTLLDMNSSTLSVAHQAQEKRRISWY
jgi:hypothetical protein